MQSKKKWTMPKHLDPYRFVLADYGLGIEELMNDRSTFAVNAYRAGVAVGMSAQVALLERLFAAGLLRPRS